MGSKLIIFAQKGEASKTIEALNATPVPSSIAPIFSEGEIATCYLFDGGLIVIANIGIHSAQMAVSRYVHSFDEVWNLGFAGALKDDLPIGTLVEVNSIGKFISFPKNLDAHSQEIAAKTIPFFSLPSSGMRLISSDFPIYDREMRDTLSSDWDLVDMEGYGVAYASFAFNKPCRLWKIVSDFASPQGREMIRKNKEKLAEKIAFFLKEKLVV